MRPQDICGKIEMHLFHFIFIEAYVFMDCHIEKKALPELLLLAITYYEIFLLYGHNWFYDGLDLNKNENKRVRLGIGRKNNDKKIGLYYRYNYQ